MLVAGGLTALLIWGEVVHSRAAIRQRRAVQPLVSAAEAVASGAHRPRSAVIVLGFADRGARPNVVNRWRARIGARTAARLSAAGHDVVVVCCGGPVRGPVPEADLLERAVRAAGWQGEVLLDRVSTTTWGNITEARQLIGNVDAVAVCSNGLHAEKAREYLRRQDPAAASRLVASDDYRPGEMVLLKPLFAAVGLHNLRQMRSSRRSGTGDDHSGDQSAR